MDDPKISISPEVQALILSLAKKAQDINREDAELIAHDHQRSRVNFWKELFGIVAMFIAVVGYIFMIKFGVDQNRADIDDLRHDLKELSNKIQVIEVRMAAMPGPAKP